MFSKIIKISLFLFFAASVTNFAQDKLGNDTVDNLVNKLKQKVLLNDTQVKEVTLILSKYSASEKDEVNNIEKKIKKLLDARQKIKFEIIKKDWLKEVIESLE
ncbi:MAG: hypothetical protein K8H86_05095 [Ignavibacteriaceae bacterium]|nr:hypothetical protein [Ignavibacteriaceae bacterium]